MQNALYRVVGQNRRALVPTLEELITSLDRDTQELVNRSPGGWGEPAMASRCGALLRRGVSVELYSFGFNVNMYQKTDRTEYPVLADLRLLWDSVLAGPCALVVDDGVFANMICSLDGETAVVVDPHYSDYARTRSLRTFDDFAGHFRHGAMIAKICRRRVAVAHYSSPPETSTMPSSASPPIA
jgi:hypothetical protein